QSCFYSLSFILITLSPPSTPTHSLFLFFTLFFFTFFFFFFLMIRRPPRSTLFPTRRSSDLIAASVTGPRFWRSARSTIAVTANRSEEHTSELQSLTNLVCRLLLEKKKERCRIYLAGRDHRHRKWSGDDDYRARRRGRGMSQLDR